MKRLHNLKLILAGIMVFISACSQPLPEQTSSPSHPVQTANVVSVTKMEVQQTPSQEPEQEEYRIEENGIRRNELYVDELTVNFPVGRITELYYSDYMHKKEALDISQAIGIIEKLESMEFYAEERIDEYIKLRKSLKMEIGTYLGTGVSIGIEGENTEYLVIINIFGNGAIDLRIYEGEETQYFHGLSNELVDDMKKITNWKEVLPETVGEAKQIIFKDGDGNFIMELEDDAKERFLSYVIKKRVIQADDWVTTTVRIELVSQSGEKIEGAIDAIRKHMVLGNTIYILSEAYVQEVLEIVEGGNVLPGN